LEFARKGIGAYMFVKTIQYNDRCGKIFEEAALTAGRTNFLQPFALLSLKVFAARANFPVVIQTISEENSPRRRGVR